MKSTEKERGEISFHHLESDTISFNQLVKELTGSSLEEIYNETGTYNPDNEY